jgi:hypothetical protein
MVTKTRHHALKGTEYEKAVEETDAIGQKPLFFGDELPGRRGTLQSGVERCGILRKLISELPKPRQDIRTKSSSEDMARISLPEQALKEQSHDLDMSRLKCSARLTSVS